MTVRAVVFDFDGVIANSEPLHFLGFRDVLAGVGVTLSERDYYARYLGYDDAGAFAAVASDRELDWSPEEVARLIAVKAVRLEELERQGSMLFPGAAELIHTLAGRCPLAIASGALREEIVRVLERERLTSYFPVVVASGDTANGKPAPDPYVRAVSLLEAASAHPLRPAECVAIEDSRWGLLSARGAGLVTVGVAQTYPPAELADADAVVPDLRAITWEFLSAIQPQL